MLKFFRTIRKKLIEQDKVWNPDLDTCFIHLTKFSGLQSRLTF